MLGGCSIVLLFAAKIVSAQLITIAERIGVPPFFIAFLLLAVSTSIPEFFVGISSALNGIPAFSLGDVIGSNIINLTFIAGLVVLLGRKRINLSTHIRSNQLFLTFAIASAPVVMLLNGGLSRLNGVMLLILYIFYVLFFIYNRPHTKRKNKTTSESLFTSITLFAFGVDRKSVV